MKKEYLIKYEPIEVNGIKKEKYNIYYFEDGEPAKSVPHKEFFGYKNGVPAEGCFIRDGFSKIIVVDKNDIYEYKNYVIEKIDNISEIVISGGFSFDNKQFSLSHSAQINWSNLLWLPESMFPIQLSTKDDDVYSLSYSNVQSFYMAAVAGKNAPLQQGNVLKQQLKNLTTKEEIDQFVIDNDL